MEIRKITITGLFGHLNHTLDLSDPINIIMGDNGVGKTVTLRLVKAIHESDFHYILQTEFDTIEVLFKSRKNGRIIYTKRDNTVNVKSSSKINSTFDVRPSDICSNVPSFYKEVAQGRWLDTQTKEILTEDELEIRLDKHLYVLNNGVLKEWYERIFKDTSIHMIRTQRLYHFSELSSTGNILTIQTYANELKQYLNSELAEAGKNAAKKDSSFPIRLVKHLKAHRTYTMSELNDDFNRVKGTQELLSAVGFIDVETFDLDELTKSRDDDKHVLMNVFKLYISDNIDKLSLYKKAADKVSLFKDIINQHLRSKYIEVNPEYGFRIKSNVAISKDDDISIDKLSSGEQNEIILFYELIFKCDNCNMVLVDEPEISLHLEWLQTMLNDFQEIFKQTGTKMLIATHSPDFVGDNYSLVQNLTYE